MALTLNIQTGLQLPEKNDPFIYLSIKMPELPDTDLSLIIYAAPGGERKIIDLYIPSYHDFGFWDAENQIVFIAIDPSTYTVDRDLQIMPTVYVNSNDGKAYTSQILKTKIYPELFPSTGIVTDLIYFIQIRQSLQTGKTGTEDFHGNTRGYVIPFRIAQDIEKNRQLVINRYTLLGLQVDNVDPDKFRAAANSVSMYQHLAVSTLAQQIFDVNFSMIPLVYDRVNKTSQKIDEFEVMTKSGVDAIMADTTKLGEILRILQTMSTVGPAATSSILRREHSMLFEEGNVLSKSSKDITVLNSKYMQWFLHNVSSLPKVDIVLIPDYEILKFTYDSAVNIKVEVDTVYYVLTNPSLKEGMVAWIAYAGRSMLSLV